MKEISPKDQLTRQLYGKLANKHPRPLLCIYSAAPALLCKLDVHAPSSKILTGFRIHFFTRSHLFSFMHVLHKEQNCSLTPFKHFDSTGKIVVIVAFGVLFYGSVSQT